MMILPGINPPLGFAKVWYFGSSKKVVISYG